MELPGNNLVLQKQMLTQSHRGTETHGHRSK
jgi:hypothetical protein